MVNQKLCQHCDAVNVKRTGTCLTFKSDSDIHYHAETSTFCGRCKSCFRSYRYTWADLTEPANLPNPLTRTLALA